MHSWPFQPAPLSSGNDRTNVKKEEQRETKTDEVEETMEDSAVEKVL